MSTKYEKNPIYILTESKAKQIVSRRENKELQCYHCREELKLGQTIKSRKRKVSKHYHLNCAKILNII